MTSAPIRVVVCLPADEPAQGAVVLAGALSLFGHQVEIALCLAGVDHPDERDAARVQALCLALAEDGLTLPDIVLLGETEARDSEPLLMVEGTDDALRAAQAVALLAAAAQEIWDRRDAPGGSLRRSVDAAIQRRDLARRPGRPPLVVAVAQVQSTWAALAGVCSALAERAGRGEIEFAVLALESAHEVRDRSTAQFIADQGHTPRDLGWFTAQVDDEGSPLALVITDSPEQVRSGHLAEHGVRMAYVPYGNNAGASEKIMTMAYDLPLHRLAWRVFVRSEVQRGMWAEHCETGADHVRVLGLPKLDRIARLAAPVPDRGGDHPVRVLAGRRPVVVWNPHFTFGPEGWSTFDRYLGPLTGWAAAHPELVLLIRPHFRLMRDLPLSGELGRALLDALHRAVATHENIVLDAETDYLPAFAVADALVSDVSSLITEWLPTGRPVCYLHKLDGPGANEDARYLFSLDVATSWEGLRAFLETVLAGAGAGADPGRERRALVLSHHVDHLDGHSSERIAQELVGSLRAELAPLSPSADRDAPLLADQVSR